MSVEDPTMLFSNDTLQYASTSAAILHAMPFTPTSSDSKLAKLYAAPSDYPFARSAAKRESVMALGSITHLQNSFVEMARIPARRAGAKDEQGQQDAMPLLASDGSNRAMSPSQPSSFPPRRGMHSRSVKTDNILVSYHGGEKHVEMEASGNVRSGRLKSRPIPLTLHPRTTLDHQRASNPVTPTFGTSKSWEQASGNVESQGRKELRSDMISALERVVTTWNLEPSCLSIRSNLDNYLDPLSPLSPSFHSSNASHVGSSTSLVDHVAAATEVIRTVQRYCGSLSIDELASLLIADAFDIEASLAIPEVRQELGDTRYASVVLRQAALAVLQTLDLMSLSLRRQLSSESSSESSGAGAGPSPLLNRSDESLIDLVNASIVMEGYCRLIDHVLLRSSPFSDQSSRDWQETATHLTLAGIPSLRSSARSSRRSSRTRSGQDGESAIDLEGTMEVDSIIRNFGHRRSSKVDAFTFDSSFSSLNRKTSFVSLYELEALSSLDWENGDGQLQDIERAYRLIAAHLPTSLRLRLVSPNLSKSDFLLSLSDGQLLCTAYNLVLRRSAAGFGFINGQMIHDCQAESSVDDARRTAMNKFDHSSEERMYKRIDNLQHWTTALKYRYQIDLSASTFDAKNVGSKSVEWELSLERAILAWAASVVEEKRSA